MVFSSLIPIYILVLEIYSLKLLGNYKLWHSINEQLIYDYSGNNNHGRLAGRVIYLDRGYCEYDGSHLHVFTYNQSAQPIHEATFSAWVLFRTGTLRFVFTDNAANPGIYIGYSSNNNFGVIKSGVGTIFSLGCSTNCFIGSIYTGGWNFYTVKTTTNRTSDTTTVQVYSNLNKVIDTTFTALSFSISRLTLTNDNGVLNSYNVVYEVWWHADFTNISDLAYLYSPPDLCNCSYGCPTSPATICLPTINYDQNSKGGICPSNCISKLKSCNENLYCIYNSKNECLFGLYHRESGDCIFYCPGGSCICSFISRLTCSCKLGYKKISDDPPACIPITCLDYTRIGYKYQCDVIKEGYALYASGECCACDIGYIAVETDPLLCIKEIPHCLAYVLDSGSYICSACDEGYNLDTDKNCNECQEGYEDIYNDGSFCIKKIYNCKEYDINIMKCKECLEGYSIDTQNKCDRCKEGYIRTNEGKCIAEVDRCIEYGIEENKCEICEVGYRVDSKFECMICEEGFIRIGGDLFECIREIDRCEEYRYEESLYEWICKECRNGYEVDTEGKCNICGLDYTAVSYDPLICELNQSQTNPQEMYNTDSQIQRGKLIESISGTISIITSASCTIASAASTDPNFLIFYINTIKLLSYIQFLNINLPYEIRKEQSASSEFISNANILSHIGKELNPSDDIYTYLSDPYSFIYNTLYYLIALLFLGIFHMAISIFTQFSKGKVKSVGSKVLEGYKNIVYIQFFMIFYIDIIYYSALKVVNVRYIKPIETKIINILDYDLAIFALTFSSLTIVFLACYLVGNASNPSPDEFYERYRFFFNPLKESLGGAFFHVIFLMRRLAITVSVSLLKEAPMAQTLVCSVSCLVVFIHFMAFRPYKDMVLNAIFIMIELSVFICYSCTVILVRMRSDQEVIMWNMLACTYTSYALHSILGYYKILKIVYQYIRSRSNTEALNTTQN